jgi:hypothetical protein
MPISELITERWLQVSAILAIAAFLVLLINYIIHYGKLSFLKKIFWLKIIVQSR